MLTLLVIFVLLNVYFHLGFAASGFDLSTPLTEANAQCMVGAGYSFMVVRAFKSSGSVDTNACDTLINAQLGNISQRDVYLFPCPTCSSDASSQINSLVGYLQSNSTCNAAWSGRIWLDIEGDQYWTGDYNNNKAWYQSLATACSSSGYKCGVYASKSQWGAIFGDYAYDPVEDTDFPLWYAHYDSNPSFSDYPSYSFSGWGEPYAKQYQGTTTVCNTGIDMNYSPAF